MPELYNSQRTLHRATYVPTRLPSQQPEDNNTIAMTTAPSSSGRVMTKVSFIRNLNIRPHEFSKLHAAPSLRERFSVVVLPEQPPSMLDVIKAVTINLSPQLMETHSQLLRGDIAPDFVAIGQELVAIRQDTVSEISQLLHSIRVSYAAHLKPPVPEQTVITADALMWAYVTNQADLLTLLDLVKKLTPVPWKSGLTNPKDLIARLFELLQEASATQTLIDDFLLGFQFEPVGRIHLERLEMRPTGIEHGELVYSVPLTPKETVNLTHREWSETTSTFETLVQDFFEGYSELGVAEKTDIASSTSSETKHSSSFDANASVNFSYNGNPYSFTSSAAVDYGTKNDDAQSIKDSRAHSMSITRTASARTRKEHKQSFRVTSVAGAQDLAVRVLTNPSDTNAMRVDYFRLMRKWQVDLIRYGLRMTYDLVIPNPGNALSSQVLELQTINRVINRDHTFTLHLADVRVDSYLTLADQFGVALEGPPQPPGDMSQSVALQQTDNQWMFANMQYSVPDDFEVASARVWAQYYFTGDSAKKLWFGVKDGAFQPERDQPIADYDSDRTTIDPNRQFSASLEGRSGQLAIDYMWYHVDSGEVSTLLKLRPKATTLEKWRLQTWEALKKADEDNFAAQQSALQNRKAQLEKDIASFDSLTLRRMEREEIMRLVLVWLFGPSFQFVPSLFEILGLVESLRPSPDPMPQEHLDPAQMTIADWDTVRKYGEFIKYIQNAIEWENVLFFSYPYFWDLIENWPFKRFLVHPDFDHRTFLRAGCARVVLTIRAGFECSFAQLVEHFTLKKQTNISDDECKELGPDHPYVTIGNEIRNFAMTNYDHVPPANPDKNVRPLLHPLQQRAWVDMQKIILALENFNTNKHKSDPTLDLSVFVYPAKLDDLPETTAGTLQLIDPWKRPYVYKYPGDYGEYDLVSYGADGVAEKDQTDLNKLGDPLSADITSWAEGNVVSRWNEYTPTAALDVAINLVLPTTAEPA